MYEFYKKLAKTMNTGRSRSVVLCGNIYDLFYSNNSYVPLSNFLADKSQPFITVLYEINKPIVISDVEKMKFSWCQLNTTVLDSFDKILKESNENSVLALEFLRQLTVANRRFPTGKNLFIVIEGINLLAPEDEIARMQFADRKRCAILHDWFSEPEFVNGQDNVVMIAESRSQIHSLVSKLPQVVSIDIPYPDLNARQHFISYQNVNNPDLAKQTAGLSIHAIRQILCDQEFKSEDVISKVEEFISSQLGDDVIEFKRPSHTLKDIIGFTKLKKFINSEVIPRFKASDDSALVGAAIAGPIGCHAKDQLILMYSGEFKLVQDIVVGDQLMGPDSTPRIVKQLIQGKGDMFKIYPKKGDSFIVNDYHILSLKRTNASKKVKNKMKIDKKYGEVVDVSVVDYLTWSKTRKGLYKLFRVGVNFSKSINNLPIDPYFLGILLGDGSMQVSPAVTSMDLEILLEVVKQTVKLGLRNRVDKQIGNKSLSFFMVNKKRHKNKLKEALKSLNLWGKNSYVKFIPTMYLTSSTNDRLEVLAGLLDTDGSYGHCFDFSSTSEKLCDDVVFVSRSLGFAAYKSGPFVKNCQNNGSCIAYRVSISGDLDRIPTRLNRKKSKPRKQKKSVLVTGFKVEKHGFDDFYGFEIDGDQRYLMGDFTVTHNSGKTFLWEAVASELDMPVLVLKNLRSQFYGQTDVIFERLKRTLTALDKVMIFIDEADTVFGGLGSNTHETERRLTGKIQGMMSDPKLKGKVVWLLLTARIEKLSPDLRRPGRAGDLIVPVLDPEGEDIDAFLKWTLSDIEGDLTKNKGLVQQLTKGYSAASYAALRSRLKACGAKTIEEVLEIAKDILPSDIEKARRYQTLQALLNCTRRSLLPDSENINESREKWREELLNIECSSML